MNIAGLYSGFCWLAVGRTLGVGARFGTYEILTAFYKGFSLHFPVTNNDLSLQKIIII